MSTMASQFTSVTIVYSIAYSGADQRKQLNCLFRRKSKKTSKLRVTGLCAGNSPVTGEFPAKRASNAENVSIWWRHHDTEIAHNIRTGIYHVLLMFVKRMHSFDEKWWNVSFAWFSAALFVGASNKNITALIDSLLRHFARARREIYIIICLFILSCQLQSVTESIKLGQRRSVWRLEYRKNNIIIDPRYTHIYTCKHTFVYMQVYMDIYINYVPFC